jgi:hypothetical protein
VCEAFGDEIERVVPTDRIEHAFAALLTRSANHRMPQLRRRILLNDARAAFCAEHTPIHDVIRIGLNETNARLAFFSSVVTLIPQRHAHM